MFAWFRDHKRRELLSQPFPKEWAGILEKNMSHYALLSEEERKRLHDDLRILIAEKFWEGCSGLVLTDEIKVTIAGQAALLLLGLLKHDYYANTQSILVYPAGFRIPERVVGPAGVVEETRRDVLGLAWNQTLPVILSWSDALSGGLNATDGHNVVLHEFAHKLDLKDGAPDGVLELEDDPQYETWAEVMSAEYQELVQLSEHRHASLLSSYGAINAAEFFAVATEAFFEKSVRMHEEHARLYGVLRGFYHQDPAARVLAHQQE
ncbi:MAG TPA: M90 family metallopeptidase [Chthonomonadaceae bacterium]|nr:M90 family metallopeptidase [Chthonomonadaceae bacterium]